MDKLYIDNQEVEMGEEVNIYLTYRSNIMGDISKILGNSSATIKVPNTLHNAQLIGNAQLAQSVSRYPYLKHKADVYRDGVQIIAGATVVLMKTSAKEFEVSLVWGASEGMRQMANNDEKLTALKDYFTDKNHIWGYETSGPEAMYGFVRGKNNGKFSYHPVISVSEFLGALQGRYGVTLNITEDVQRMFDDIVIPILASRTADMDIQFTKYQNYNQPGSHITWDVITSTAWNNGETFNVNDCKATRLDVELEVYGWSMEAVRRQMQDAYYIAVEKETTTTNEDGEEEKDYTEIADIPLTEFTQEQNQYLNEFTLRFKGSIIDDIDTFNAGDKIYFNFKSRPVQGMPTEEYQYMHVTGYGHGSARLVFHQDSIVLGETYYVSENLPDISIVNWLKGIMQMFGLFAYQGTNSTEIQVKSYAEFFRNKSVAQDWSEYLTMTSTDASEAQEFEADGFYQLNRLEYKNDDAMKNMNSSFIVENETLEAEGAYITLPFESVGSIDDSTTPGIARISMYEQKNEDAEEWNPTTEKVGDAEKKIYILKRLDSPWGGDYLSRKGLDWDSLKDTYYKEIIQSVQEARYITATFYLDPVTLQNVDFGRPIYLSQYASYFAIIEIKTKKNHLAEIKLLKLA